jgi:transcriptional regulator GlxA family with amidase domain
VRPPGGHGGNRHKIVLAANRSTGDYGGVIRRIVIVVVDRFQPLDVTGPTEVFDAARRLTGGSSYRIEIVTPTGEVVRSTSGLGLMPDGSLASVRGSIDTLVVAGGEGVMASRHEVAVTTEIARLARRSRRVASVCNGALLLAAAGLLEGRRAVTHWSACDVLADEYPNVTVEPDRIDVCDGTVFTSAGVTTGIDLALALVVADHGPEIARQVARWLVVFAHRPGGQSQFSESLAVDSATDAVVRDLLAWLPANLTADCSVPALAHRASMSERTLARRFRAATGRTTAAHVEALRVEAARAMLESGSVSLPAIADACGFGTVETMHRSFRRLAGTTPDSYRAHFRIDLVS